MKITKTQAKKLFKYHNLNPNVVNIDEWTYGLNVELEHGKKYGIITNITDDNLLMTSKIALAHLIEYPNYYNGLKQLEYKLNESWIDKKKPNIFL